MRISDWSSDVCSSDLKGSGRGLGASRLFQQLAVEAHIFHVDRANLRIAGTGREPAIAIQPRLEIAAVECRVDVHFLPPEAIWRRECSWLRSEEHTSELQSLMRISYAVFCLKKKKYKTHDNNTVCMYTDQLCLLQQKYQT